MMILVGVVAICITIILTFVIINTELESNCYDRVSLLLISTCTTAILNIVYYTILIYSLYNNLI